MATDRTDRVGTHVLVEGRLEPGYAEVHAEVEGDGDGPRNVPEVVEVVLGDPPADAAARPGIVCPPLVNAHTHLGDAALAPLELEGTIEEVFAPPDGLKHRHLRELSRADAVAGMAGAVRTMARRGTARFYDFREGGLEGVGLLEEALAEARADEADGADGAADTGTARIDARILGRPEGLAYDADEVDRLLDRCAGLGLSALRDFPAGEAEAVAKHVRDRGGLLALHASEAVREPIEPVLDLGPDLLVHLCQATAADLAAVADAGVPVAVCPRSNARFGLRPPVPELVEAGVAVHLGTDNAMFQTPDVLEEVHAALSRFEEVDAATVLGMAVRDPVEEAEAADPEAAGGGFPGEGPVDAAVLVPFEAADPAAALRTGASGPARWLT